VHDDGRYVERISLSEFAGSRYACGMFWFGRKWQTKIKNKILFDDMTGRKKSVIL